MKLNKAMRAAVDAAAAELEAAEREERPPREPPIDDRGMSPAARRRAYQARTLARLERAKAKADATRERR